MPGFMHREQFATAVALQADLLLRARPAFPHLSFVSCVDLHQPHFQICKVTCLHIGQVWCLLLRAEMVANPPPKPPPPAPTGADAASVGAGATAPMALSDLQEPAVPVPPPQHKRLRQDGAEGGAAAAAGAATDKKGCKTKGKGRGGSQGSTLSTKELSSMVHQMNRLLLSHDGAIQELEALNLCTFLLPEDTDCMLQGKLAGQNYNTQVRSSTAEQLKALALAPPHVYIYLAIVKKILGDEATGIELGEVSSHHKEQIEILGTFAKKVEAGSNSEAVTIIPHFKLNTTYDDRWRVRFSCPDAARRLSLSWSFLGLEGEGKKGKAPRGKLARDCQQWTTAK